MKLPIVAASVLLVGSIVQAACTEEAKPDMTEPFMNAIARGDVEKVREMLRADTTLARTRDEKGQSAIVKASYHKQKAVVALLLESGVELDVFEAAMTGQTKRLRVLLAGDKSLANSFARDGFTPLGLAAFFGHRESVEALLAAGAKVNVASKDSMKVTPLQSAAAAREVAIARLLIEHGAEVNVQQPESGFTALHEAAANGDLAFAKLLLEHKADLNAKMTNGKTPLALAIARERPEMAAFLREQGAAE